MSACVKVSYRFDLSRVDDLSAGTSNEISAQAQYLYGKYSRHNGAGDADGSTVLQELKKGLGPEEQLSNDEVSPRIHLLLQVSQVLLIALGFWVTSGVAFETRGSRLAHISTV